jgi:hypothetical protein
MSVRDALLGSTSFQDQSNRGMDEGSNSSERSREGGRGWDASQQGMVLLWKALKKVLQCFTNLPLFILEDL